MITWRRLPLVALVVAGLVAIVALVARGRPLAAGAGRHGGLPASFWDFALTSVVIVLALVVLAVFASLLAAPRVGVGRFGRRSWKGIVSQIVGLMSIALVVLTFTRVHPAGGPDSPIGQRAHQQGQGANAPGTTAVHFRWEEVAVVVGLLLAAVAVALVMRNGRRLPPLPSFGAPEAVAAALDISLDDLRADPDLRSAIIAAYARMERALGAAGVPRLPAEAPLEYLERALLGLETSAPAVRRLTDLFEWAKFSDHEPEPTMRDEAVDGLEAIRDELRAPTSVAA